MGHTCKGVMPSSSLYFVLYLPLSNSFWIKLDSPSRAHCIISSSSGSDGSLEPFCTSQSSTSSSASLGDAAAVPPSLGPVVPCIGREGEDMVARSFALGQAQGHAGGGWRIGKYSSRTVYSAKPASTMIESLFSHGTLSYMQVVPSISILVRLVGTTHNLGMLRHAKRTIPASSSLSRQASLRS